MYLHAAVAPTPVIALAGLWSPLPGQASTRLLVPPSHGPAGSEITGNLGSNHELRHPLPAGHRFAPSSIGNRLIKAIGEGCSERKIDEYTDNFP